MNHSASIFFKAISLIFLLLPSIILANQSTDSLESKLKHAESDSLRIELLLLMGNQFEESDSDSALHFYQQALELTDQVLKKENTKDDNSFFVNLRAKVYEQIASVYILWGNYDEALSTYELLHEIYNKTGNWENYTATIKHMGNIFYYQGRYPQALDYYNQASLAAKEYNRIRQLADITLNIGTIYFLMGHYAKSLEYHQNALDLYESVDLTINHKIIYLGKGNIYSELSDYDKALQQYHMALQQLDKSKDHLLISNIQLSIGTVYYDKNNYPKAEEHYLIALEHARKLTNRRVESQALLNLAILYSGMNEFTRAQEALKRAQEYAIKSKNQHIQANILRNMANLEIKQGNLNVAFELALQSLKKGREIESVEAQSLALKIISGILEKQGKYREALNYYQDYKNFNDSLLDLDKQKQITEMDAVYQSEKQLQALELQQLEIEKNQNELKQKKLLANIFIIAFVLLLISSVIIFIINNKRIRTDRLVNKQLAIINKKQDIIFELEKLSQLQGNRILKLEKNIAEKEKAHANEQEFAERLRSNMLHSNRILSTALIKDSFVFSPSGKEFSQKGFLWTRKIGEKLIITLIGCDFEGIRGSLINVYMAAMLEKFSHNEYLNDPRLMSENVMKQLDQLAQDMNISSKYFSAALLWIESNTQKVIFAGNRISLYLAISRYRRNPPGIVSYDYQQLQQLRHDNSAKEQLIHKDLNAIQLKKSDRLYLLSYCNRDKYNESDSNTPNEPKDNKIVRLIDQNQDMEIQQQKAILHDYLTRSKNNEISTVIGIEL